MKKEQFETKFRELVTSYFEAQYNENTDLNEVNTGLTLEEFKEFLCDAANNAGIEFNAYLNDYPEIDFLTDEYINELVHLSEKIGNNIFNKHC